MVKQLHEGLRIPYESLLAGTWRRGIARRKLGPRHCGENVPCIRRNRSFEGLRRRTSLTLKIARLVNWIDRIGYSLRPSGFGWLSVGPWFERKSRSQEMPKRIKDLHMSAGPFLRASIRERAVRLGFTGT